MKRLTLIRHAKSDWSDASLSDFDRPLNERGKKAAPMMGKRIAKRRDTPELLISSPAKRALKTALLISKELGLSKKNIREQLDIFEAKEKTLIKIIQGLSKQKYVALVGHNPGLSDLANWLCPDSPEWLPTCAVLTLELDVDSWSRVKQGCGRILVYDYPKKAN